MNSRFITNHPNLLYIASFSELWERFSFYIVEALLIVYLIEWKHLPQSYSYELLGTYIANSFILTVFGAYFGQKIIGFRQAVNLGAFLMSIGYALLLNPSLPYLHHALALIVVGSAFFKPNMACFVGSLYKIKTGARYGAAYNIYYAAIMIGVILSTSISGYVLEYFGWDANFSIASFCMMFAFIVFWIGNQCFHAREDATSAGLSKPFLSWLLTCLVCVLLWWFVQTALYFSAVAYWEMVGCVLLIAGMFGYEFKSLPHEMRRNFIACIVLLFFSCVYWALLFQLFFSFNIMVKLIVNRHFLEFNLPSPLFMGIESLFVVIFSPLLGALWIKKSEQGQQIGLFSKYTFAFVACSLGMLTLIMSLHFSSTPHFLWIILAYACIGLGEAILAPTALAMIAQLNQPAYFGVMMAALYVFWGFGTKFADVLAQWSIFPSTLNDAAEIAPYFYQATIYYFGISAFMVIIALIGRKIFRI